MAYKKKILIVEDNSDIRELMAFFLERVGYEVIKAGTGLAGIEQAKTTHPDLITMDLGLPDIRGDEVTSRLKIQPSTKHIPVVIITAYYEDAPLVQRALAAGACEVLYKPVELRTLADTLRRVLTTTSNEESSNQSFEQHAID